MQSLCALFESAVAIVLAAACTIYIVSPSRGRTILKRLALGVGGCYLGLAAAGRLLAELRGPGLALVLAGLSAVAYLLLRAGAAPARGVAPRPPAAERIPVVPHTGAHQEDAL